MALNFPSSPTLNQVYTDSTSGFSYEWNGYVWISFSAASSSQIKVLDDISASFNSSTQTFPLTLSGNPVTAPSSQSLRVVLGGIVQAPVTDYIISGSNIIFTVAPTTALTCSIVSLGPAIPINTIPDGTVTDGSLRISTTAVVGSATTFTEDLVVSGDARVTGILTVGSSSITLNGITDSIRVGTGLTLSSSGINVSGVITATSFFGSGSGLTGVGLGTTGSINTSGIITASSFSGNGSGLTGVAATTLTIGAGTTALPSISPTGDTNTGIFFPSADTIAFSEGGTEAMRVDSSGRLLIGISTSGNANGGPLQLSGGITFPATAVAASDVNTLDDYEEGTWTALLQEYPAGSTQSTTGRYTKIGRCVHIQVAFVNVDLSAFSGNVAYLTGAPFASGAETIGSLMTDSFIFDATGTSLSSWIESANTQINFYASETNAAKKNVRISPGAGRSLWLNLVYTV